MRRSAREPPPITAAAHALIAALARPSLSPIAVRAASKAAHALLALALSSDTQCSNDSISSTSDALAVAHAAARSLANTNSTSFLLPCARAILALINAPPRRAALAPAAWDALFILLSSLLIADSHSPFQPAGSAASDALRIIPRPIPHSRSSATADRRPESPHIAAALAVLVSGAPDSLRRRRAGDVLAAACAYLAAFTHDAPADAPLLAAATLALTAVVPSDPDAARSAIAHLLPLALARADCRSPALKRHILNLVRILIASSNPSTPPSSSTTNNNNDDDDDDPSTLTDDACARIVPVITRDLAHIQSSLSSIAPAIFSALSSSPSHDHFTLNALSALHHRRIAGLASPSTISTAVARSSASESTETTVILIQLAASVLIWQLNRSAPTHSSNSDPSRPASSRTISTPIRQRNPKHNRSLASELTSILSSRSSSDLKAFYLYILAIAAAQHWDACQHLVRNHVHMLVASLSANSAPLEEAALAVLFVMASHIIPPASASNTLPPPREPSTPDTNDHTNSSNHDDVDDDHRDAASTASTTSTTTRGLPEQTATQSWLVDEVWSAALSKARHSSALAVQRFALLSTIVRRRLLPSTKICRDYMDLLNSPALQTPHLTTPPEVEFHAHALSLAPSAPSNVHRRIWTTTMASLTKLASGDWRKASPECLRAIALFACVPLCTQTEAANATTNKTLMDINDRAVPRCCVLADAALCESNITNMMDLLRATSSAKGMMSALSPTHTATSDSIPSIEPSDVQPLIDMVTDWIRSESPKLLDALEGDPNQMARWLPPVTASLITVLMLLRMLAWITCNRSLIKPIGTDLTPLVEHWCGACTVLFASKNTSSDINHPSHIRAMCETVEWLSALETLHPSLTADTGMHLFWPAKRQTDMRLLTNLAGHITSSDPDRYITDTLCKPKWMRMSEQVQDDDTQPDESQAVSHWCVFFEIAAYATPLSGQPEINVARMRLFRMLRSGLLISATTSSTESNLFAAAFCCDTANAVSCTPAPILFSGEAASDMHRIVIPSINRYPKSLRVILLALYTVFMSSDVHGTDPCTAFCIHTLADLLPSVFQAFDMIDKNTMMLIASMIACVKGRIDQHMASSSVVHGFIRVSTYICTSSRALPFELTQLKLKRLLSLAPGDITPLVSLFKDVCVDDVDSHMSFIRHVIPNMAWWSLTTVSETDHHHHLISSHDFFNRVTQSRVHYDTASVYTSCAMHLSVFVSSRFYRTCQPLLLFIRDDEHRDSQDSVTDTDINRIVSDTLTAFTRHVGIPSVSVFLRAMMSVTVHPHIATHIARMCEPIRDEIDTHIHVFADFVDALVVPVILSGVSLRDVIRLLGHRWRCVVEKFAWIYGCLSVWVYDESCRVDVKRVRDLFVKVVGDGDCCDGDIDIGDGVDNVPSMFPVSLLSQLPEIVCAMLCSIEGCEVLDTDLAASLPHTVPQGFVDAMNAMSTWSEPLFITRLVRLMQLDRQSVHGSKSTTPTTSSVSLTTCLHALDALAIDSGLVHMHCLFHPFYLRDILQHVHRRITQAVLTPHRRLLVVNAYRVLIALSGDSVFHPAVFRIVIESLLKWFSNDVMDKCRYSDHCVLVSVCAPVIAYMVHRDAQCHGGRNVLTCLDSVSAVLARACLASHAGAYVSDVSCDGDTRVMDTVSDHFTRGSTFTMSRLPQSVDVWVSDTIADLLHRVFTASNQVDASRTRFAILALVDMKTNGTPLCRLVDGVIDMVSGTSCDVVVHAVLEVPVVTAASLRRLWIALDQLVCDDDGDRDGSFLVSGHVCQRLVSRLRGLVGGVDSGDVSAACRGDAHDIAVESARCLARLEMLFTQHSVHDACVNPLTPVSTSGRLQEKNGSSVKALWKLSSVSDVILHDYAEAFRLVCHAMFDPDLDITDVAVSTLACMAVTDEAVMVLPLLDDHCRSIVEVYMNGGRDETTGQMRSIPVSPKPREQYTSLTSDMLSSCRGSVSRTHWSARISNAVLSSFDVGPIFSLLGRLFEVAPGVADMLLPHVVLAPLLREMTMVGSTVSSTGTDPVSRPVRTALSTCIQEAFNAFAQVDTDTFLWHGGGDDRDGVSFGRQRRTLSTASLHTLSNTTTASSYNDVYPLCQLVSILRHLRSATSTSVSSTEPDHASSSSSSMSTLMLPRSWLDLDYATVAQSVLRVDPHESLYYTELWRSVQQEQYPSSSLVTSTVSTQHTDSIHITDDTWRCVLTSMSMLNDTDGFDGVLSFFRYDTDRILMQKRMHSRAWTRIVEDQDAVMQKCGNPWFSGFGESFRAVGYKHGGVYRHVARHGSGGGSNNSGGGDAQTQLVSALVRSGQFHVADRYISGVVASGTRLDTDMVELHAECLWRMGLWDQSIIHSNETPRGLETRMLACLHAVHVAPEATAAIPTIRESLDVFARREHRPPSSLLCLVEAEEAIDAISGRCHVGDLVDRWTTRLDRMIRMRPFTDLERLLVCRTHLLTAIWTHRRTEDGFPVSSEDRSIAPTPSSDIIMSSSPPLASSPSRESVDSLIHCDVVLRALRHHLVRVARLATSGRELNIARLALQRFDTLVDNDTGVVSRSNGGSAASTDALIVFNARVQRCKMHWVDGDHAFAFGLLSDCLDDAVLTASSVSLPQSQGDVAMTSMSSVQVDVSAANARVLCLLGKWAAQSQTLSPRDIISMYFKPATHLVDAVLEQHHQDHNSDRDMPNFSQYYHLAHYCDQVLDQMMSDTMQTQSERLLHKREQEFKQIRQVIAEYVQKSRSSGTSGSGAAVPDHIRALDRHRRHIIAQIESDRAELTRYRHDMASYLSLAIQNYIKSLIHNSRKHCHASAFRFLSLWFSHAVDLDVQCLVEQYIRMLPTNKLIVLMYQISARLVSPLSARQKQQQQQQLQQQKASSAIKAKTDATGTFKPEKTPVFHDLLEKLVLRIVVDYPYHSLPHLMALKNGAEPSDQQPDGNAPPERRRNSRGKPEPGRRNSTAPTGSPASNLARTFLNKLTTLDDSSDVPHASKGQSDMDVSSPSVSVHTIAQHIDHLFTAYIQAVNIKRDKDALDGTDSKKSFLFPRDAALVTIRDQVHMPLLTAGQPLDRARDYRNIIHVVGFDRRYRFPGGINEPKVVFCKGSDGRLYQQLIKGNDDMRQDAVLSSIFDMLNVLLAKHGASQHGKKQSAKDKPSSSVSVSDDDMRIRTYRIVPLSPQAGVLQWVDGTEPIGMFLVKAHTLLRPQDWNLVQCRNYMAAEHRREGSTPESKLAAFRKIAMHFRPVFSHVLLDLFPSARVWTARRAAFVRSVAVSSMAGHVVGLGDRHSQNILFDRATAQVIHIDLGIAFDQGRLLSVPETVPFRLTRDMVDAMGITGIEGAFRRTCEETLRVLRQESHAIWTLLDVFRHDPLYRWKISPMKMMKVQKTLENQAATSTMATSHATVRAKDVGVASGGDRHRQALKILPQGQPQTSTTRRRKTPTNVDSDLHLGGENPQLVSKGRAAACVAPSHGAGKVHDDGDDNADEGVVAQQRVKRARVERTTDDPMTRHPHDNTDADDSDSDSDESESGEAARALVGVRRKLATGSSVASDVAALIAAATDEGRLSRMFPGWQPWL